MDVLNQTCLYPIILWPINFVGLDIDPTPSYGITVRCRLSGLKIHFNSNKMICCIRMITTIKFRIRGYDSLAQINSSVI
jgi:hypothetical protein|tara:strand:- start:2183 stop:2419 length:237 start_codon:yes stop_codon:yes gene_type:complete